MSFVEGEIEETVELDRNYPTVSERYFTRYYFVPKERKKENSSGKDVSGRDGSRDPAVEGGAETPEADNGTVAPSDAKNGRGNDRSAGPDNSGHTCVMVHTNKLCLVTLSHRHPVLAGKKTIIEVNYDVGKFNRLDNQVSGKGKRGAQILGPQSQVCIITCSDGTKYSILAGVHGKLVEVNERLILQPQLLSESPDSEGYLALVLPPLRNGDFMRSKLFAEEEYEKLGFDHPSEERN